MEKKKSMEESEKLNGPTFDRLILGMERREENVSTCSGNLTI